MITEEQIIAAAGEPVAFEAREIGEGVDWFRVGLDEIDRIERIKSYPEMDYRNLYTADSILAAVKPLRDRIAELELLLTAQTEEWRKAYDIGASRAAQLDAALAREKVLLEWRRKAAPLIQHSDACSWITPLPTSDGYWGCDCGAAELVLDGEALALPRDDTALRQTGGAA